MNDTWRLVNYFDVWRDAEEGWWVNNQCIEFDDLHIDPEISDKEIVEYLKGIGFLNTSDLRRLAVENWADGVIEIFQRKEMMPICALIKNN